MKIIKKLWQDENGNFGILGAFGASVTLAVSALVIDTTVAYNGKASMQSALDAATLAAASSDPNSYNTIANDVFNDAMGLSDLIDRNVEVTRNGEFLEGRASGSVEAFFGGVLMPNTLNLSADTKVGFRRGLDDLNAVAGSEANGQTVEAAGVRACVIILSSDNEALRLNSNSQILAPECQVHVHSTQNRSITADSNQHNVDSFCLAAAQLQNNNSGLEVDFNCDVTADPYAGKMPVVDAATCDYTNMNLDGSAPVTFTPGTYCGGVNVNGNVDITFEPGVYVLTKRWNVNGGLWTGKGVTFVLAQNASNQYSRGNIQFNSGFGGFDMSAPASGDYANMLIVDEVNTEDFNLNSGNLLNLTGAIYMPKRKFRYNSNAATLSSEVNFVVNKMTINSGSALRSVSNNTMPRITGETYPLVPRENIDGENQANNSGGEGDQDAGSASDDERVESSEGTPYLIR